MEALSAQHQSHSQDSLDIRNHTISSHHFLTSVKRHANNALAAIIAHELNDSSKPLNADANEVLVKSAYACFLRLNCEMESFLARSRLWKRVHSSDGLRPVMDALVAACSMIPHAKRTSLEPSSDWSGEGRWNSIVQAALSACNEAYPSLTGNYYSLKPTKVRKTKRPANTHVNAEGTIPTVSQSFEVLVPEGLHAGDTFLTLVQTGEGSKKVRLTVPEGEPSTLRFSLQISTTPKKAKPTHPGDGSEE
jgi:hypothetical protein